MILTRENYYTPEADMAYMSCSQYQAFCECEAKEMAILQGRWIPEEKEAFLVGNYFHTYFEGEEAHREFIAANADKIFKKQTKAQAAAGIFEKYAPFSMADKMIDTAMGDPVIQSLLELPGENEKILTGEMYGVPWRIRMDKYSPGTRLIIDYKTVANIWETKWSDELHMRASFIDTYGYMFRAAVYSEIEKQAAQSKKDPQFLIIAISKQDPPDKEVLLLNHKQRYEYELEKVRDKLPKIMAVKEGRVRPTRCGMCDYCRATKRLEGVKPYYVIMPEFREQREVDYGAGSMLDNPSEEAAVGSVPTLQETTEMDLAGV